MLCGYQRSILGRLFIYGSPSSFSDNDVHETDIIHRLHARSILTAEWLIEHCASELTQIAEITQTRPLNSTSDRKRSFLVNGPSVARGRFISIARTRDSRWSRTDDRKRVIGGNESIFYSRQAQGSNFAVYLSRPARWLWTLCHFSSLSHLSVRACNNSSLLLLHISGRRFTSWNSPCACQFLR